MEQNTPLTIAAIADALGLTAVGATDLVVKRPVEPAIAGPEDLALAMDPRFADQIAEGAAEAAMLWADADWQALGLKAAILSPRARMAMAGVTQTFDRGRALEPGIHPTATVDATADLGADVSIGPYTIIGRGAKIGPRSQIFGHVTIADDAVIGPDALIWEGVRIGHSVRIGARVRVQYNSVIGADGFSFVTPEAGAIDAFKAGEDVAEADSHDGFARIHSLGAVVLGDDVELGAGCAIDRGTVRDTVIGTGTKLDNLVHVGHNVTVGQHCLLCGQVGVAGSATIGDRVVLGGQVGVADHVNIGSDVLVAGKAGISSNVPGNRAMMGNPAIPMETNIAAYKVYRRLPRLVEKVETLQKQVSKLLSND